MTFSSNMVEEIAVLVTLESALTLGVRCDVVTTCTGKQGPQKTNHTAFKALLWICFFCFSWPECGVEEDGEGKLPKEKDVVSTSGKAGKRGITSCSRSTVTLWPHIHFNMNHEDHFNMIFLKFHRILEIQRTSSSRWLNDHIFVSFSFQNVTKQ